MKTNETKLKTEIILTFDGDQVTSPWHVPGVTTVLCTLCGKCDKKEKNIMCVNANPYCG